nr:alpha/beta fold hydrolase [uncultured Enterobacter sp.]
MIDFDGYPLKARQQGATPLPPLQHIDGLSLRIFYGEIPITDVVVIYHGGGVHGVAGYEVLAHQLSATPGVAACLVDIRGHGQSSGPRGTVSHPRQVWHDVDTVLAHLETTFAQARCHLFGHSSGGGMLLNYITGLTQPTRAASLTLLAPELGPFSNTAHPLPASHRFATVKTWPFVLNALSGGRLFSHYPAVTLNFPEVVLKSEPHFVHRYSVNMANALTPRAPQKQLARLALPTLIIAAEQDELFSAQAMGDLVARAGNPQVRFEILPECGHLDCVFGVSEKVLEFMK